MITKFLPLLPINKLFNRSYVIRGTFPQYRPPETVSLINNKLGSEILEKMKGNSVHKNFMLENIKRSKWTADERKRFYNELGLERSLNANTEISSIGRVIDNSKDMSSILIHEGLKDNGSFNRDKRELFSGKFTEKNEQSTKLTADQSASFRYKNRQMTNNPVYRSYQG